MVAQPRSVPSRAMRVAMSSAAPRLEPNSTSSGVPCRPSSEAGAAAGREDGSFLTSGVSDGPSLTIRPWVRPGRGRTWIVSPSGLRVRLSLILSW